MIEIFLEVKSNQQDYLHVLIFSLGENFRLISEIYDNHNSSEKSFKDLNGDGVLEFIAHDWNFVYWKASFAGSPWPEIVYEYDGYEYKLNLKLNKITGEFDFKKLAYLFEYMA